MTKFLLAAAAATATLVSASAEPVLVKNLYTDESSRTINWDNTLTIDADEFAGDDITAGCYIQVNLTNGSGAIELKADGTWLPGTRQASFGDGDAEFKTYITPAMLTTLKEKGLELCGAEFTLTGLAVYNDGFVMPDGAIWGGYFWVSDWNTLEIFKTAVTASYTGQRYMKIYLSDDNGDNTGYFMKVLTQWESTNDGVTTPEVVVAGNDAITHTARVAVVDLQDADLATKLEDVNTLMIQSNPEGGNPYNITAVALTNDDTVTALTTAAVDEGDNTVDVYNLHGIMVKSGVNAAEAAAGLPAGIYIAGGRKIAVR